MKKQDFYFDLPKELIAQYPLAKRSAARMLTYHRNTGSIGHHQFSNIADFLSPGDLLVFNDSKVIPARLFGHKQSGGRVELLVERVTGDLSFLAHIKTSKTLKVGTVVSLDNGYQLEIVGREEDLFDCQSHVAIVEIMQAIGHIPLPPYITRQDELLDINRYQTVYANIDGSVAAPTAGLHFEPIIFSKLKDAGIEVAYTTLHVGAGTFKPVRTELITDHKMHAEQLVVSESLCGAVAKAKALGKRVIAVGTTALRSLESAGSTGVVNPCSLSTNIFIYPGYEFKICDGLLTNFHIPESTLLMLVSAFIGQSETMRVYQEAIVERYRFFSYGDTSLFL